MQTTSRLTEHHRQVLTRLADEGSIDDPDAATTRVLEDLVEAGLATERPRRLGGPAGRGPFSPTRSGRAMAVRFA